MEEPELEEVLQPYVRLRMMVVPYRGLRMVLYLVVGTQTEELAVLVVMNVELELFRDIEKLMELLDAVALPERNSPELERVLLDSVLLVMVLLRVMVELRLLLEAVE